MKFKRVFGFISLILVIACLLPDVCYARIVNFADQKIFVDSKDFTLVASGIKEKDGNNTLLTITNIYKANGNDSDYRYVIAKAEDGPETRVEKSIPGLVLLVDPNATIYKEYMAGANVHLYCKGNNSLLDCLVSGTWNIDY